MSAGRAGRRKVVLATSIAETSLTIEGVRVVVDCGLARVPRFEPDVGVTRLETVRVSRAAADQRRGRAGRTEPGVCYRLWDEPQTASLPPFAEPEILDADLAGLLLDCAAWGVTDPATLAWLDPPPTAALAAARARAAGARRARRRRAASRRTAGACARCRCRRGSPRMVLRAAERGAARDGRRDRRGARRARPRRQRHRSRRTGSTAFRRDRSRRAEDMRRLARGWARAARSGTARTTGSQGDTASTAGVCSRSPIPTASPRRAARRGSSCSPTAAAARVDATDALARAPFLVVAEMHGHGGRDAHPARRAR